MTGKRHKVIRSPSKPMHLPAPHDDRQLTVSLPLANTSSTFKLPMDWTTEKVLRRDKSHYDMYYYEPGTGQKFRSIKEVERYLNGEGYPSRALRTNRSELVEFKSPRRSSRISNNDYGYHRLLLSAERNNGYRKMLVSGGKLFPLEDESENDVALVDYGRAAHILPDGWVVEEVPRRSTRSKHIDRYYYEPETGRKFRSLADIEKHLAELDDNAPLSKALEKIQETQHSSKLNKTLKSSDQRKNCSCGENTKDLSSIEPLMKVNWVLASPQGDKWNTFISEILVSDAVKNEWADQFTLFMNEGLNKGQTSGV